MNGASSKAYRPDIDGLRAVAVLLVLLFHCKLGFPGGFIGVDVFFVISGYLITGLILKRQEQGDFRLGDFWSRRIRRIAPAALAMTLVTLAVGYVTIFPGGYVRLAQSAIAQQLMASNFFFNRYTGYFGDYAEHIPLLHTWSLAVEEQFYLVFPLLLMAVASWRKAYVFTLLLIVTLASFGWSLYGVVHQPSATFYLLPARVWELLLGGLLCYVPTTRAAHGRLAECLSVVGLGLILVPALLYDAQTRFPGVAALPPCLGAALLIYSNSHQRNAFGRLLSARPVVAIGLISYSLYLWHWPILVFAKQYYGDAISTPHLLACFLTSFPIAYASWRWIELPFREERPVVRQRRLVVGICCCSPVIIGVAGLVWACKGFPERMPPVGQSFMAAVNSKSHLHTLSVQNARQAEFPAYGDPQATRKCLVWGDSHAMSLMPGIDQVCQATGLRVYQATHEVTPPLLDFVCILKDGLNEQTPAFSAAVLEFVEREKIEIAVLAGLWSVYTDNKSFERQLRRTVAELNARGAKVILVIDVPHQFAVPLELARQAFWGKEPVDKGVTMQEYLENYGPVDNILRRVAAESLHAEVVDPAPYFTDRDQVWHGVLDGQVLYRDPSHLTVEGSLRLAPLFHKTLR
jgi:peptidoglycan/LPS O-acetylase OafA/YrhL